MVRVEVQDTTVTIDVSSFRVGNEVYDLTEVFQGLDSEVDYRDFNINRGIWSIGKHRVSGKIYGSTTTCFYQFPDYDCVWLR